MEQFVIDQIKYGLKYLPGNLAKSFFIKKQNASSKALREQGFICGVCHPNSNIQQIKDAGIQWIRIDIPYPFENDGSISQSYVRFKEKCSRFTDKGVKVMAVTPYPGEYIENGADTRTAEGRERAKETARFLITDLKGYVGAMQITNEMGIPRFTLPLTMNEAVEFIALHLKEMYPLKGDILLGYNSAGPQADLNAGMLPYREFFDYVGIDIYIGCFDAYGGFMWMFDALVRYLWAMMGKPVLIQEFGYISGGHPKTKKQKRDLLKKYGAKSENDAKLHIAEFTDNIPEKFSKHIKYLAKNDESRYFDLLFNSDLKNHLYCELPPQTKIPGYDHTPVGQAKFYEYILPHLYSLPFVCGAIIYCYSDSDACYICGQSDCPTETRWGLVTRNSEPKPSYYAVKKAFGRIHWMDNISKKGC